MPQVTTSRVATKMNRLVGRSKLANSLWPLAAILVVSSLSAHMTLEAEAQSSQVVLAAIAGDGTSNNFSSDDNRTSINLSKRNDEHEAGDKSSSSSTPQQATTVMMNETERRYRRRLKSSSLPEFSAPIGNVTAVLGRDTRLICTVEHLGQYQVAWLKEETKTIISIDTNIIITNYRIFLIPDEEERKWVLHIKDVQESDRGFYQCQVNTSPMRATSGYLEVVVPPTIIESQTSQVAEVVEHSNVSIQCRANGHPRPSISWRREDSSPIRLNGALNPSGSNDQQISSLQNHITVHHHHHQQQQSPPELSPKADGSTQSVVSHLNDVKSDRLTFYNVDRSMAGVYVCSASNGIPTQTSKRIPLHVKFAPKTSVPTKYISVSLGDQFEVDCLVEAYPKANSYWSKVTTPSQVLRVETPRWSQQQTIESGALSYKRKQADYSEMETLQLSNSSATSSKLLRDESAKLDVVDTNSGSHRRIAAKFNAQPAGNQFIEHPKYNGHLHNRIQLRRQVVDHHPAGDELASPSSNLGASQQTMRSNQNVISGPRFVSISPPTESKGYVTVKQTAINSYTYKLRITVAKMQVDDYGQYHCISTNSLGSSESLVIVTKADRPEVDRDHFTDSNDADYQAARENSNYQHDSANLRPFNQQQQQPGVRQISTGNRVVYDTNYLQAIKTRQNNGVSSSKLQQKLKLRQYSDRNLGTALKSKDLVILITTIINSFIVINYYYHYRENIILH